MVGELADIRANAPWRYDEIRVPVVAGHGTTGSPHHQRGMAHLVEQVPGARLVVMDGCPHNAPNSHAERFRAEMVDPLLAMAGAPWG